MRVDGRTMMTGEAGKMSVRIGVTQRATRKARMTTPRTMYCRRGRRPRHGNQSCYGHRRHLLEKRSTSTWRRTYHLEIGAPTV